MIGGKNSATSGPQETHQTTETKNTTLKNLISMGGSNKCAFTSSTQNSQSQGVVYISGGQMRGDFSSVAAGKTIASHMIVKSNTSYVWTDAAPQGFKMSFDSVATQNDAGPQGGVDPNAQVDYACSPWVADAGMFVLPSTITFQDMSALVPGASSGAPAGAGSSVSGSAVQCSACDQIPDAAAKAQCRAALSCK